VEKTAEEQYLELLDELLTKAFDRPPRNDRTEVGCHSVFGKSIKFDLRKGFPLLTTKKVWFNFAVEELLWFLSGSTNYKDLPVSMQHLWSPWANEEGDLGPIYGKQFRSSGGLDIIVQLCKNLMDDPNSRRHVMSTWQNVDVPKMGLAPCHGTVIQFFCEDRFIDLVTHQRSCDIMLGLPMNLASYSLLLIIIASITGRIPRHVTYNFGDLHLYHNHKNAAMEQLTRDPRKAPELQLNKSICLEDLAQHNTGVRKVLTKEHFTLLNYNPHPAIKASLAI
jgi:thymidylate synthase